MRARRDHRGRKGPPVPLGLRALKVRQARKDPLALRGSRAPWGLKVLRASRDPLAPLADPKGRLA
ncbi:hypothetical protein LILAB_07040 [Corallococcus macrosporus]|uniref:Uncharacterized protein n=1 Tax=Myxococcus fulvus (strain ATCC BAA-855 / HW-1) TaxID=483219 RepID=F8CBB6_MYXFH|nr:hypothetical protein LILAB_07040 [Corallococcus macrosporus]